MSVQTRCGQRQVIAYNDAADSGNPMHDAAAARALNFKGPLVPGVSVFGYMTTAVLAHFGTAWLERGHMAVKFLKPVYDGDTVTIDSTVAHAATAEVLQVSVLGPTGETCVVGSATLDIADSLASRPLPPSRELPDPKWPATPAAFANAQVLGSLAVTFPSAASAQVLEDLREEHPIYQHGVTHPAWLLRQANLIVDRNFALGPWIHFGSEVQNFTTVRHDQSLEVRAQVLKLYQKKGRDCVDLDVAILLSGDPPRPAMRVLHHAIYDMHAGA